MVYVLPEIPTTNPALVVHVLWEARVYNSALILSVCYMTQNIVSTNVLWEAQVNNTSFIVHIFWKHKLVTQYIFNVLWETHIINTALLGLILWKAQVHNPALTVNVLCEILNSKPALMIQIMFVVHAYNPIFNEYVLYKAHVYNSALLVNELRWYMSAMEHSRACAYCVSLVPKFLCKCVNVQFGMYIPKHSWCTYSRDAWEELRT